MRAGAGLVRVAAAESVVARLSSAIPELTWSALDEEAPGLIAPAGWRRAATDAAAHDAAVIGPGLGRQHRRTRRQLIASLRVPAVVDADGLNALAETLALVAGPARAAGPDAASRRVRAAHRARPRPTRMTTMDARPRPSRRRRRWGQVVVLKGARTVVADPEGEVLRVGRRDAGARHGGQRRRPGRGRSAPSWRLGRTPMVAAACGVAVHGAAGLLAAERIGSAGTMARDLAGLLPAAIAQLRGERVG